MSTDDRIRRPALDRTEPIRAWSALLRGPGGSFNDVVARSVDLGYRVVDEYIRQGQQAAERFSGRGYAPETVTADVQELGARMAQYTSDFFGLWVEVMQAMLSGGTPRAAAAPHNGAAPGAPAPHGAAPDGPRTSPPRVRVEIASLRPAEVVLDLRPEATGRRLVVPALRTLEPDRAKLEGVVVEADPGDAIRVRMRIPDELPAGTYNGVIVDDETSRPLGTVSVRVGVA